MTTKLTLSLKKDVIEKAKIYAKAHDISLSFLIENFLQKLISEVEYESPKKGSIVDELSGILKLDPKEDYQEEYIDYLTEKYK